MGLPIVLMSFFFFFLFNVLILKSTGYLIIKSINIKFHN